MSARFDRFWPNWALRLISALLSRPSAKNWNIKNPWWKIAISRPRVDRFPPNLARQCSSVLLSTLAVEISKNKNPRWWRPPFWKVEKSPYLGRNLTDFDQIWHGDAARPYWAFWRAVQSNSNMATVVVWKIEKSAYFGRGLTDFDQFWLGDAIRPSWAVRPLKILNFKNPWWRRTSSCKI